MSALLANLNISAQADHFFCPYFREDGQQLIFEYQDKGRTVAHEYWNAVYNRVPSSPGIWLAGTVVPVMARHLFLFHSALEAISFCSLYPTWLARPGNCIFAALGLLPEPNQISLLAFIYPHARLHLCFGNGLIAGILDCRIALWLRGKDTSFLVSQKRVHWRWRGKPLSLAEPEFSFHHFQQACGLRSAIRTHKPPGGLISFFDLLTLNPPHDDQQK